MTSAVQVTAANVPHVRAALGRHGGAGAYNSSGQLGDGTTTQRTTPVAVNGVTRTSIARGRTPHLRMIADGTVKCWGDNGDGELGNQTTIDSSTAVTVVRASRAAAAATSNVCGACTPTTCAAHGATRGTIAGRLRRHAVLRPPTFRRRWRRASTSRARWRPTARCGAGA